MDDLANASLDAVILAKDGVWPQPDRSILDDDREPAPEFPLDPFGPARCWIEAAAEGAGAPVDYVGTALLAVAGGLIANARWGSPWSGWREPSQLFAALVGSPSQHKTPALMPLLSALREIERDGRAEYEARLGEWQEQADVAKEVERRWKKIVEKAVSAGEDPPARPSACNPGKQPQPSRVVVSDTTTERLAEILSHNPRGLIMGRDELAGWLGAMDRYAGGVGGGDRAFWLQAFNGGPHTVDRRKDGSSFSVPRLSVGIVGTIQPDRLESMLLKSDDDGLASRFIYAFPERRPPRRPTRTADPAELLHALRQLRSLPLAEDDEPFRVQFTAEAADIIQRWREVVFRLEQGASGLMLSWQGKLPGLAVRLATIFTFLSWAWGSARCEPGEIDGTAADAAVWFLEAYALPMARRTLEHMSRSQEEKDARRLLLWIRDNLDRLVVDKDGRVVANTRGLRRIENGPGLRDSKRFNAAAGFLERQEWVRQVNGQTGGRPRSDLEVSPHLWSGLAQ